MNGCLAKEAIQSSIEVRFHDKEVRKDMPKVLEQIRGYIKRLTRNENMEPVAKATITITRNNASLIANIPGPRSIF